MSIIHEIKRYRIDVNFNKLLDDVRVHKIIKSTLYTEIGYLGTNILYTNTIDGHFKIRYFVIEKYEHVYGISKEHIIFLVNKRFNLNDLEIYVYE